jgi:hypothetical protein
VHHHHLLLLPPPCFLVLPDLLLHHHLIFSAACLFISHGSNLRSNLFCGDETRGEGDLYRTICIGIWMNAERRGAAHGRERETRSGDV